PGGLNFKYKIARALVFKKIHGRFGGRLQFVVSGGAPISKTLCEFFHSVGVLLLEGYGLTETTSATHVNRPTHYKFGTVGLPIDGVECKIADDGEVLVRGDIILLGYYKNEKMTKEVLDSSGWFHTGDLGEIDSEGFLKIVDRKKDIIVTSAGKNVAPQKIENALKTSVYISQGMVFGDKRKFLSALISIDEEKVKKWATNNKVEYKDLADLSRKAEVKHLIDQEVDKVNKKLASFETIKKFNVLEEDFTMAAGEMTPSLKLKRAVIQKKHQKLIDQFYEERYN
ncbi:MAG: AMP-binding protein, partial [Spirochaetota bacterium]|nr:AMP-binding protein [Spirochaetota bacterium]